MRNVRVRRAVQPLRKVLVGVGGQDALGPDGYAVTLESNLLYPMSPAIKAAFATGAGRELDSKMRAPHSSSALALNTFSPWLDHPEHLELVGVRSFKKIAFEKEYPTGLRGRQPHLDLVAEATEDVVAVESKCLEYLEPKVPHFAPSYQTFADVYGTRSWFSYVTERVTSSLHLNIAQLVKHWLGLSRAHQDRRVTLLYV